MHTSISLLHFDKQFSFLEREEEKNQINIDKTTAKILGLQNSIFMMNNLQLSFSEVCGGRKKTLRSRKVQRKK